MIQLFLSRGEHDVSCVLFHLFRHSLINAINLGLYPSWLILQYIQINYNIWLPLFWARTEVWTCSTEKKAVLWLMSQSECLKNKSSADQELFVLTNSCYSSYSLSPKDTTFFPFTAVNWTVFFFTCLKKQEEMLVSVSESRRVSERWNKQPKHIIQFTSWWEPDR